MAKTAVIFCSEYGSTKKYAEYIAEKLQADLLSTTQAKDLSPYDTVVYGGGIYAGSLNGNEWLKKNQEMLCNKRLVIFTCSFSDPEISRNTKYIREGLNKCLSPKLMNHAKIFCFHGALDYQHLKFAHKGMMKVLFQILKHKKERSLEEEAMLQTQVTPADFVDTSQADRLILYIKD